MKMKKIKDKKFTNHQKKGSTLLNAKILNLLDTTSDNVPRCIIKKWIEVHDQANEI